MKTVVLIDFNNLCFRSIFAKEVKITEAPDFNLWRYFVFDAIYKSLWLSDNVNEVVLAVDHRNPWRKSYFPRYKESRKKGRAKDDTPWTLIYDKLLELERELRHHMPFKVLKIQSAEADDIIAVLALHTDSNFVIHSNDEDYIQLCSDRVKVWNPPLKEFRDHPNPKRFIIEKCLMGQAKDDIFNVLTPNNWGQTKLTLDKRKPPLGPQTVKTIISKGYKKWLKEKSQYTKLDVVVNPEKNYKRNQVLFDFNFIPNTIINRILDAYYNSTFPPPDNIYQFFKKYNMQSFIEKFTQVENKLLKLYE